MILLELQKGMRQEEKMNNSKRLDKTGNGALKVTSLRGWGAPNFTFNFLKINRKKGGELEGMT